MKSKANPVELGADNPFLASLSAKEREQLFDAGEVFTFRPEDLVFVEGEPAAKVLFPLRGRLRMSKTATRGRRQVMCNVEPGKCGGICMLALADCGLADVRAIDSGEILSLDRTVFQGLARENQKLCEAAWSSAAECMTHFSSLVENLSFHKVAQRVAAALLEGTENDGDLVRRTQAELAAEVGTTREVVARCLAGLQNAGIVRLGRGRITVTKREKLHERAD